MNEHQPTIAEIMPRLAALEARDKQREMELSQIKKQVESGDLKAKEKNEQLARQISAMARLR
jgi:hypothetical protein